MYFKIQEISKCYKNDGYTAGGSLISVHVTSDEDIKVQYVTRSWNVEHLQVNYCYTVSNVSICNNIHLIYRTANQ